MEGGDRLLAPLGLIVFGLFIFFGTGSESELLDSILPYVFSAPFLLSGFFILSVRLGELTMGDISKLEVDTSSPESIFNSMENYSKFKQQEGKYAVQSTGYLLLTITITVSAFTVLIGLGWLFLLAAFSGMGGNGNGDIEDSFNFFIKERQNFVQILFTQLQTTVNYLVLKQKGKLLYYPQILKGLLIYLKKQIVTPQLIFST